jgi:hypothetical protein
VKRANHEAEAEGVPALELQDDEDREAIAEIQANTLVAALEREGAHAFPPTPKASR